MKFFTDKVNYFRGMLQVELPQHLLQELQGLLQNVDDGKELTIEVKVKRNKRSRNANSYCWVLCNKIAKRLHGLSDVDVYRQAIRMVGRRDYVACTDNAYERFAESWNARGIGSFAEKMREAKGLNNCSTIVVYYGSSEYDTKEMSVLLEYLVDEAKNLGCDVLPEADRQLLLREWGELCG